MVQKIIDDFNTAYRNFNTDGVETSGDYEPEKSKLRGLGVTISDAIEIVDDRVDATNAAVSQLAGTVVTGTKQGKAVDFATTGNITLSGEQAVDGPTVTSASRVLVKNQTTQSQNGTYLSGSGAWTRVTDMDQAAEFPGYNFYVKSGTVNGGTSWVCTALSPVTVGTTAITFEQSQGAVPVVPTLAAGTLVTTLTPDMQLVLLNAAGTTALRTTLATFLAKVNEDLMGPTTYIWPAHRIVRTTAIELIPVDAGLQRFDVVNTSDAWAWISEGGIPATMGGFGSVAIPPKGIYSTDFALPGAVSAISAGEVLLTVKFKTTTNYNVAARAAAQLYTDKVNALSPLTAPQVTVLQDFYSAIYSSGALANLGVFYNFIAPGLACFINLADLDGQLAAQVGTVTRTNWRNLAFDGTTGYLNSRKYMADFSRENDHSLLVYPGSAALQGSSRVAIGEAEVTLTPARTSTTIVARSLDTATYTPSGFTAGTSLLSMSRTATDRVLFRQGQTTKVEQLGTASRLLSSRNILIGARNVGPTGGSPEVSAGSYFSGPMVAAGAGRGLTDSAHVAIHNAVTKLILDASAF